MIVRKKWDSGVKPQAQSQAYNRNSISNKCSLPLYLIGVIARVKVNFNSRDMTEAFWGLNKDLMKNLVDKRFFFPWVLTWMDLGWQMYIKRDKARWTRGKMSRASSATKSIPGLQGWKKVSFAPYAGAWGTCRDAWRRCPSGGVECPQGQTPTRLLSDRMSLGLACKQSGDNNYQQLQVGGLAWDGMRKCLAESKTHYKWWLNPVICWR